MSSDRARITYDATRQYRAVVAQQGRVTLEADTNEAQTIAREETRAEALDIVGPSGTPDDGYRVMRPEKPTELPLDFTVQHGTMYVGGLRVTLPADIHYADQGEWLDHMGDPLWVPATEPADSRLPIELIYLLLREQEVSAVEDSALRDVALGGPDTAQRLRIVQRIVRLGVAARDCPGAWKEASAAWAAQGLTFHDATMRLTSSAGLLVSFGTDPGPPDLCEPDAHGGYLGAENQLIRVQIAVDPATDTPRLLWGYDNASFLYPVQVDPTGQTLTFGQLPVDDYHKPTVGQAVEVLRAAVQLTDIDYIASATGIVAVLTEAYDPDTQSITLPAPLPAEYLDGNETPTLFLRVWQEWQPAEAFTSNAPIDLTGTGVQVTLRTPNGEPFHHGDYWTFAVRPSTPQQVYPQRYLEVFQPAEGPRLWACPLAVIAWQRLETREGLRGRVIMRVLADCRNPFDNLVELTQRKVPAIHVVRTNWMNDRPYPIDRLFTDGLVIDVDTALEPEPGAKTVNPSAIIVSAEIPQTLGNTRFNELLQPLILAGEVTRSSDTELTWRPRASRGLLGEFLKGLKEEDTVRVRVTAKGHVIWSMDGQQRIYLDGQAFGRSREDGSTDLIFPSGDSDRASDFESWFFLSAPAARPPLQVQSINFLTISGASSSVGVIHVPPVPDALSLRASEQIHRIDITFNRPVRPDGFGKIGTPQSVHLQPPGGGYFNDLSVDGAVAHVDLRDPSTLNRLGPTVLQVVGTPAENMPAVLALDDGTALDGNFDGQPGGDFILRFQVIQ